MKQSQTLGEEQHSVSFIERAANENQSKFFRQVEDEGDVEVDAVVNNRQSILDADLRAQKQLHESILSPLHNRLSSSSMLAAAQASSSPVPASKQQRYKQILSSSGQGPHDAATATAALPPLMSPTAAAATVSPSKKRKASQLHQHQSGAADGSALVKPDQLYTAKPQHSQFHNSNGNQLLQQHLQHLNINITGNGQVIQNPSAMLGVSHQAVAAQAAAQMGIQMGTDGKFYASAVAVATNRGDRQEQTANQDDSLLQQHHVSPHFSSNVI